MRLHTHKKIEDGELDYAIRKCALFHLHLNRAFCNTMKNSLTKATVLQHVLSSPVFGHLPLLRASESGAVKLVVCAPDLG